MVNGRCAWCSKRRLANGCPRCGAGAEAAWNRHVIHAKSLEHFVDVVTPLAPDAKTQSSGQYWYRGQPNAKWPLQPSFQRLTQHVAKHQRQAISLEEAARLEFMSKAHLFIEPGNLAKVKTIPCWWALMQHHGAPTRLLDWSVSPYVAAYFASHQDGSGADGAVWCFCHQRLLKAFVREYKATPPDFTKSPEEDRKVRRLHRALQDPAAAATMLPLEFKFFSSARMAEQQGRFTMCLRVNQDHMSIAAHVPPTHLKKIVIPHEKKPGFLAELRRMNITAAALFPGVDGLGRSIAELTCLGTRHAARARRA